ncbi:MAG: putative Cleavage and polyadenylation specificity factor subunit 3, partial [Streblomastix strix]
IKISAEKPYGEKEIEEAMEKIECINYHQVIEYNGIEIHAITLGAAMFSITINGMKLLYTGDFSIEPDRLLCGAEVPQQQHDILIVESTYGTNKHEERRRRERDFTSYVRKIIQGRGKCLIPIFALGRAQELLVVLEEYWSQHQELHKIPIYYVSSIANKVLPIFRMYIDYLNEKISGHVNYGGFIGGEEDKEKSMIKRGRIDDIRIRIDNEDILDEQPKERNRIQKIGSRFDIRENNSDLDEEQQNDMLSVHKRDEPCVVLAAPGMLQSGLSRELFELWVEDRNSGIVIPGYTVEGTPAHELHINQRTIVTQKGERKKIQIQSKFISFSAHSDFTQTSYFISQLRPQKVILVHGESKKMNELNIALKQKFSKQEKENKNEEEDDDDEDEESKRDEMKKKDKEEG